MRDDVVAAFGDTFGRPPEAVVRSPGRINLMGEHTDYNGGFVLPIAIDQATWLAAAPRDDARVAVRSLEYGTGAIDLGEVTPAGGWIDYVAGTLGELGHRVGFDLVVGTEIPVGAGLASSAALEIGVALVAATMAGTGWDPVAAAQAAQRAENRFVGVATGIMDQLAAAVTRPGHALFLDCRSLHVEHVPLPAGIVAVVCDTGTRRRLVDSGYDERRAGCERAAALLGVASLRDTTLAAVADAVLDEVTRRRARHVVTENVRVGEMVAALAGENLDAVAALMAASQQSMRDDFEISSPALDAMVGIATQHSGCVGARLTGGGFAGGAVALVTGDAADEFVDEVGAAYSRVTGNEGHLYPTAASGGAMVL